LIFTFLLLPSPFTQFEQGAAVARRHYGARKKVMFATNGNKISLDRAGNVPLHIQIRRMLSEQIQAGHLGPGAAVPSERDLSEDYSVSRMTVRQALRALREDGLIYHEKGVGTFVARRKVNMHTRNLVGFTEDMRQRGMTPSSQLIGLVRQPAQAAVAEALGLAASAEVFRLERLRLADGEPMAYEINHLPVAMCPELDSYDLSAEALYHILATCYGVQLSRADEELEALAATRRAAHFLAVKAGAPLWPSRARSMPKTTVSLSTHNRFTALTVTAPCFIWQNCSGCRFSAASFQRPLSCAATF
jgi:GntR family transcriptional regulator